MNINVVDEGIKNQDRYKTSSPISKKQIEEAIEIVLTKLDNNMEKFGVNFPSSASNNLVYEITENKEWTSSFWTGMLWLAYELTQNQKYTSLAQEHLKSFERRLNERIGVDTHDLGFLYTLSCVAAYKVTKNERAKQTAINAARYLTKRYWEKAGIIQAWGRMDDQNENGRFIIDCLMNLPLLYWAWQVTGENEFYKIAYNHAINTAKYIVRDDASTYHTFYVDVNTGLPLYGKTHQGYSDNSCWARGQAWGIYGFTLSYVYTRDLRFIELAKKLLNYFLNRLPEDYIPCWDLIFVNGNEPKDSSAGAICLCALLELLKILPLSDEYRKYYENAAINILFSLLNGYLSKDLSSDGLLLHGVYSKPQNRGVDEHCIWGDYFFFEALVRFIKDWNRYW